MNKIAKQEGINLFRETMLREKVIILARVSKQVDDLIKEGVKDLEKFYNKYFKGVKK